MKKTLILASIIALTMTSTAYAGTTTATKVQTPAQKGQMMPPPPREFKGDRHRAEFERRLNLTEAQKAKIEKNRKADMAKLKPIKEQIQAKKEAKFEIIKKYEETNPDLIKLNKEIKALKEQEHKIKEANRKSFEALLTKEQKAELAKMKTEREKNFKGHRPHHPEGRPPFEK